MVSFKKLLSLILGGAMCATVAFGFSACGSENVDNTEQTGNITEDGDGEQSGSTTEDGDTEQSGSTTEDGDTEQSGSTTEDGDGEQSGSTTEDGDTEQSGSTTEGGDTEQSGGTTEDGDTEQSGGTTEGGDTEQSGGTTEGGDTEQSGGTTEGSDTEQSGGTTEGGDTEQSGSTTEGGDTEPEVTPAEVSSIIISGDTVVYIGYTKTLTVNVIMSDGSVYDGEITWASSDESVVTVTDGTITGVAEGTANITVTAGGVISEAYTVTVSERPSDKVDAAGWVAAMTSSDVLNSSFAGTETYTSETSSSISTVIGMVDLVAVGEIVTGTAYNSEVLSYTGSDEQTNYIYYDLIGETCYKSYSYVSSSGETCRIKQQSEDGFTLYDISMVTGYYMHFQFADESYFGGEYFNYDDEAGAYVWEYSSDYTYGTRTYRYEIKIYDGNMTYIKASIIRSGEYESVDTIEVYYTYGGVSVTIPDEIQSKFDALTETGDDNPDDEDTGDAGVIVSDIVDAAGWVAAMTSSDIYNSTATGAETEYRTNSSGETTITQYNITIEVDVVETNGSFKGKIYTLDVNGENSETEYYLYDESGTRYYSYNTGNSSEDCYYSWDTVSDVLGMWYLQYMLADESYFGGDYFNYSDEDGAYVWERTSGSYTYRYIVKICDGNVVYAGLFTYGDTSNESVEIYYTYGNVSITIPEDIQSKLDALTAE